MVIETQTIKFLKIDEGFGYQFDILEELFQDYRPSDFLVLFDKKYGVTEKDILCKITNCVGLNELQNLLNKTTGKDYGIKFSIFPHESCSRLRMLMEERK